MRIISVRSSEALASVLRVVSLFQEKHVVTKIHPRARDISLGMRCHAAQSQNDT